MNLCCTLVIAHSAAKAEGISMGIWIKKAFDAETFDILLRDFRQHFFAMGGSEEMLMIRCAEAGITVIFIHLPVEQHKSFYVGFEVCAEDELPGFATLLAGSESGYRALVQKRAASRKTQTESGANQSQPGAEPEVNP